jgi:hypothetical protein
MMLAPPLPLQKAQQVAITLLSTPYVSAASKRLFVNKDCYCRTSRGAPLIHQFRNYPYVAATATFTEQPV